MIVNSEEKQELLSKGYRKLSGKKPQSLNISFCHKQYYGNSHSQVRGRSCKKIRQVCRPEQGRADQGVHEVQGQGRQEDHLRREQENKRGSQQRADERI